MSRSDGESANWAETTQGLRAADRGKKSVSRKLASLPGGVDDAEQVALGVFEHYEVLIGLLSARVPASSNAEQTFHLMLLVGGVEVEVQAILPYALLGNDLQGDIDIFALRIAEHNPVLLGGLSGNIAECILPEGGHRGEVIAIDYDGTDSHHAILSSVSPVVGSTVLVIEQPMFARYCSLVPLLGDRK